jgi:hypothetical protein
MEHAKTLLKWRDKCYACGGGYDPTENHGDVIPLADIKRELRMREHVPNKSEAKTRRRQLAKEKRNR